MTEEQTVAQLRRNFKASDDRRDAGLPTNVAGVHRYNDLAYGTGRPWHLLDLYVPTAAKRPLPTIINIHGGGWCYGTKETYQFYGLDWARRGFAFVNPNYRLAPAVTFPAELDDVNCYVDWVVAHADEYHLDLNNVILMGDSAGGQMAEQYATILTNPQFRQLFGYSRPALTVRALILNSAATELLRPDALAGAVRAYFPEKVVATHRAQLATESAIQAPFLPTFICTATADFLKPNALRLATLFKTRGIEYVYRCYGTAEQPRGHVFLIDQRDLLGKRAVDDEQTFIQAHLS